MRVQVALEQAVVMLDNCAGKKLEEEVQPTVARLLSRRDERVAVVTELRSELVDEMVQFVRTSQSGESPGSPSILGERMSRISFSHEKRSGSVSAMLVRLSSSRGSGPLGPYSGPVSGPKSPAVVSVNERLVVVGFDKQSQ
eukprot:gene1837-33255_t